jgi:hypothetical protein
MIRVVVTAIRALPTDDDPLHELTVQDRATGRWGTVLVSDFLVRELLGDCPTSDLVEIAADHIVWS